MPPLPVSSLLPPGETPAFGPTQPLPSPVAVLGPLPPTAPLSVAAAFVELADLEPFGGSKPADQAIQSPGRVLVVTGERVPWHQALEDMDSEWTRNPSPTQAAFERIDVRYVPSAAHARLLLSLLTSSPGEKNAYNVPLPSAVILYNLGGLVNGTGSVSTIADYLDLVAAGLAAARHLGGDTPLPLVILEPQLEAEASLPLLPSGDTPPKASRPIPLKHALERLLGPGTVGTVKMEEEGDSRAVYYLELSDELYLLSRRTSTKAEFAAPPNADRAGGCVWEWA